MEFLAIIGGLVVFLILVGILLWYHGFIKIDIEVDK